MNEQLMQWGPMWVLAGLAAGWLAENLATKRGYGLIVDMALGLGWSVAGGGLFVALSHSQESLLVVFAVGFTVAISGIAVQRLCWPSTAGGRRRKPDWNYGRGAASPPLARPAAPSPLLAPKR